MVGVMQQIRDKIFIGEQLTVHEAGELWGRVIVLTGALRELHDMQNGPPLIREAERWRKAMDMANQALIMVEPYLQEETDA